MDAAKSNECSTWTATKPSIHQHAPVSEFCYDGAARRPYPEAISAGIVAFSLRLMLGAWSHYAKGAQQLLSMAYNTALLVWGKISKARQLLPEPQSCKNEVQMQVAKAHVASSLDKIHLWQDVIQFGPLAKTLGKQVSADPGFVPQILGHVGLLPILDWTRHFIALGTYTALYRALNPLDEIISNQLNPQLRFGWKRTLERWKFGSGSDYRLWSFCKYTY